MTFFQHLCSSHHTYCVVLMKYSSALFSWSLLKCCSFHCKDIQYMQHILIQRFLNCYFEPVAKFKCMSLHGLQIKHKGPTQRQTPNTHLCGVERWGKYRFHYFIIILNPGWVGFVSVFVLSASLLGPVGNVSSSQYLIICVTQLFRFLLIGWWR